VLRGGIFSKDGLGIVLFPLLLDIQKAENAGLKAAVFSLA